MITKVIMPQLGESVDEGTITRWLVTEGDVVKRYEPLLEVASDKVDTEVPAPVDGVVIKLHASEGVTVRSGTLIAEIGVPGETATVAAATFADAGIDTFPQQVTPVKATPSAAGTAVQKALGFISPVVARLATEHHVDLTRVKGEGVRGRIRKKDVLNYIKQMKSTEELTERGESGNGDVFKPAWGEEDASSPSKGDESPAPHAAVTGDQVVPLSRMRRLIADHMVQSKRLSPHVTTVFVVDMRRVVTHRYAHKAQYAQDGVNLTFTPYFVAAAAQALKKHPLANSSWSEKGVVLHRAINIGMATAIEDGLIVPVVKNADSYNLLGLARIVNDLARRARAGKLTLDEIKGSTFSITNHGTGGSIFASPIINQPNAGILGVGAIHKEPVIVSQGHPLLPDPEDYIAIRPVTYLSFTIDHRILDGASADAFMTEVKVILENWQG